MLFDVTTAALALEDLLDLERRLILAGTIGDLARTNRQKTPLLLQLAGSPDPKTLARLRTKAARNQELLQAALRGLEAAKTRIARLSLGGAPLRTYGPDGAAADLRHAQPKSGINHRV
jgi:hypothetical protein